MLESTFFDMQLKTSVALVADFLSHPDGAEQGGEYGRAGFNLVIAMLVWDVGLALKYWAYLHIFVRVRQLEALRKNVDHRPMPLSRLASVKYQQTMGYAIGAVRKSISRRTTAMRRSVGPVVDGIGRQVHEAYLILAPARLAKRVDFLTLRFASHAPFWQFGARRPLWVWTRQRLPPLRVLSRCARACALMHATRSDLGTALGAAAAHLCRRRPEARGD